MIPLLPLSDIEISGHIRMSENGKIEGYMMRDMTEIPVEYSDHTADLKAALLPTKNITIRFKHYDNILTDTAEGDLGKETLYIYVNVGEELCYLYLMYRLYKTEFKILPLGYIEGVLTTEMFPIQLLCDIDKVSHNTKYFMYDHYFLI